jgi:hypothetical protein
MNKLSNLLLISYARGVAGAVHKAAPADARSRVQMASGLGAGLMALSVTPALAQSGKARENIVSLIQGVSTFVLMIVGAAIVVMAAWGAFLYITAGGNSNRATKAQQTIKNVAIGLAVGAAIFLIRSVVLDLIDGAGDGSGDKTRGVLEENGEIGK